MDFLMETRDLTKAWRKKTAVDRVNLHVRKGEIYGFVGPNGAGKSTVMKMMMNLIRPDAGEARIFGEKMGDESYESFKRIGSIIEAPCFYEKMTGRENLELYCEYMGYHNRERIEEALSRMGHLLRLELKKFDLKKNILITLLLILFSSNDSALLWLPIMNEFLFTSRLWGWRKAALGLAELAPLSPGMYLHVALYLAALFLLSVVLIVHFCKKWSR